MVRKDETEDFGSFPGSSVCRVAASVFRVFCFPYTRWRESIRNKQAAVHEAERNRFRERFRLDYLHYLLRQEISGVEVDYEAEWREFDRMTR